MTTTPHLRFEWWMSDGPRLIGRVDLPAKRSIPQQAANKSNNGNDRQPRAALFTAISKPALSSLEVFQQVIQLICSFVVHRALGQGIGSFALGGGWQPYFLRRQG
jgi:hypothetical protein